MRILVVSDIESNYIWDFFDKSNFEGVECVISCGDLKASYLSFLVTMLAVPVFYIHGNHDKQYLRNAPLGCDCIEDTVITFKGLRIAGLGGCKSFDQEPFQFSEPTMHKRVKKFIRKVKKPIDIFVSHSPTAGLGDDKESRYHKGFDCFFNVYDKLQPRYHLHGHNHFNYNYRNQRELSYNGIKIINGYNYYFLEIEPL